MTHLDVVRPAAPHSGPQTQPETATLTEQLLALLRSRCREPVHGVYELDRASAGLSRETWTFVAALGAGDDIRHEAMVLRRDPARGLGLLDTDRVLELRLLRALEASNVPTPIVLHEDLEGAFLERPSLVMRRSPGLCDYTVLNGNRALDQRLDLAHRFCRLLADVHLIDWKSLGINSLLTDPGQHASTAALDHWSDTLVRRGPGAYPELAFVEKWLRQRAPSATRTALVHGDFKPGNTLIVDQEISVLLDWETAHLGDPLEDLGWVTQPLRTREHLIESSWTRADLVEAYQRQTGFTVDPVALAWWQAFATYKTAVIQLTGLAEYQRGASNRLFREPAACIRLLLDVVESGLGS